MQATKQTQVSTLHWEDHLEKGMATLSSILAWEILWTEEPDVHVVVKSWTQLSD